MSLHDARSYYLEEAVNGATPARLLTLLYDRLARDLARAQPAMAHGRFEESDALIDHAREILTELLATLDGSWEGAADLARVYAWMVGELITARVRRDVAIVASVHRLVGELGGAWHAAAAALAGAQAAPAPA